jgi:hypothetical protein
MVTTAEGGWTDEELAARAERSQQTRMLYGAAAEAAAKTAWPPKVIALGRVLAQGLLADGDEIDLVQYALAAMTEMERIHVELLELQVEFTAVVHVDPQEQIRLVETAKWTSEEMSTWGPIPWPEDVILAARPRLRPVFEGLIGLLEGYGLVRGTGDTLNRLEQLSRGQKEIRARFAAESRMGRTSTNPPPPAPPVITKLSRTWSPTRLGKEVLCFSAVAAEQADAEPGQ